MTDLVEGLESEIRRHISRVMPADHSYLEQGTLVELMIDYRVWRGRFVRPTPRSVRVAAELEQSPKRQAHVAALTAIEQKIAAGEEINSHLSTRVAQPVGGDPAKAPSERADRDLLLAEWGVHHLHLSTEMGKNRFTKRTREVLFVVFREADAYLLGIYDHPSHDNWAAQEIFAVMVRNWPDEGLAVQSRTAVGPSQDFSDDERLELRGAVNLALFIDGTVYFPAGFGLSLDGTPMRVVQAAQQVMWALTEWKNDTLTRLREVESVPPDAHFRPAIASPVPGFEEYAGFSSGSVFIPIGRLC